ncbi:MAG TPA: tyrosine-type recombinase/integrase [Candidatus Nanoarchaeia archaeon]|nr:tyrosine-type recombinase/integrase [Candidatus Nanoarchaeia archaeon]
MKYPDVLMMEMKLRGFSPRTAKTYCYWNDKFLAWFKGQPLQVRQRDLDAFLLMLADRGCARGQHQATAALRFYYTEILKRKFGWRYPKIGKRVPRVLSRQEIYAMLTQAKNIRHRLLLLLLYGSGLRVSEAVKVQWQDIDLDQGMLLVHEGKGNKDRYVVLSQEFVTLCKGTQNAAESFLFPTRSGHITIRTAQEVVKQISTRAGILRRIHPHMLRASFATHLLADGTSLWQIQKLLGHAKAETTQLYLNRSTIPLVGIRSPVDKSHQTNAHKPL